MANDEISLRVNETTEFLNAISMFRSFLVQSNDDSYYLKWSIIAAHNSLQALMVLALKGTSNLQVIKWKNKEYRGKSQYEILSDSDQKLDNFLNLFEKIKSMEYMQDETFVDVDGEVTEQIVNLNETRNNFIHYLPCSWSLSADFANQILAASIYVICFLLQSCTFAVKNFNQEELCFIRTQIDLCNSILQR